MLLWSSVNLPNSRLGLFGRTGWDWCCCCGFRPSAAVVEHHAVIQHQRARETCSKLLSSTGSVVPTPSPLCSYFFHYPISVCVSRPRYWCFNSWQATSLNFFYDPHYLVFLVKKRNKTLSSALPY